MRLDFAILADAATVTADGKFSILNGDLGAIEADTLPMVHPYFAMVVKISATKDEQTEGRLFRAELISPDGAQAVKPASGILSFQPNIHDKQDNTLTAGIVANFPLLVFSKPGKYVFHLFVDNEEIGTAPLYLKLVQHDNTADDPAKSLRQAWVKRRWHHERRAHRHLSAYKSTVTVHWRTPPRPENNQRAPSVAIHRHHNRGTTSGASRRVALASAVQ